MASDRLGKRLLLARDNVLVKGAKHCLLLDFRTGGLFQLNDAGRDIILRGGRKEGLAAAVRDLGLGKRETQSFVADLLAEGVLELSNGPAMRPCADRPVPCLDFVWVEVTSRCNLRCVHCYAGARPTRRADPYGTEVKRWISEAAELGCRKIQFTGGECTLRPDLADLIDHARLKGFTFIEIFTNGTLLTKPLIDHLKQASVHVALSVYSHRARRHEAVTGVAGSFRRTLRGLQMLLDNGVTVRGAVIAVKQNQFDADATVSHLRRLGVSCGSPDPVRPTGRGSLRDIRPTRFDGGRNGRTGPDFIADRRFYDQALSWNTCWSGKAAITSSGDVIPCVFARDQVVGSLSETSLAAVVKTGLANLWALTRDKVEVCRDCEYRYLCKDCRPWAYGLTGNLNAKSPWCTYDPYTGRWGRARAGSDGP